MAAFTDARDLPPLPEYTLKPLPSLLPPVSDKMLTVLGPIAVYWAWSMVFHVIDVYDLFPQYRLHTPAELVKRNHVTRWQVVRDVLLQQVMQFVFATTIATFEPEDVYGNENYNVAVWGQRIRLSQRAIPKVLGIFGLDALQISENFASSNPSFAGALAGGIYNSFYSTVLSEGGIEVKKPAFAPWELLVAKAIYWLAIPALQFVVGIVVLDTWQYFWHRAMHLNKWMYNAWHSRHHRLYVPYAYGALYNHPIEGFLMDILGSGVAYLVAGMTTRQGLCFYAGCTLKTIDDHCGYAFPWDPLQHITANNASYHDIHHQSWGIKTNFSQPFFTFWDRVLGTIWSGGDVSLRYEKARIAAQRQVDINHNAAMTNSYETNDKAPNPYAAEPSQAALLEKVPLEYQLPVAPAGKATQQAAASREQVLEDPNAGIDVLIEEAEEEKEAIKSVRKSTRRKKASSITQSDSLRGLRERVSAHGRTGGVLGMDRQ